MLSFAFIQKNSNHLPTTVFQNYCQSLDFSLSCYFDNKPDTFALGLPHRTYLAMLSLDILDYSQTQKIRVEDLAGRTRKMFMESYFIIH